MPIRSGCNPAILQSSVIDSILGARGASPALNSTPVHHIHHPDMPIQFPSCRLEQTLAERCTTRCGAAVRDQRVAV